MVTRFYSVAAIIADGAGRFLAVSRKDDPEDLGWPGGKIEPGEAPEEAIVREVFEKAGLVVTRRALRSFLIGPDEEGRLCVAFDVLQYKGEPQSRNGAWVGWAKPWQLATETSSSREYNVAVFEKKGLPFDPPLEIEEPQPEFTLEEALIELTGVKVFPKRYITFLYGPSALLFCPPVFVLQPRLSFDQKHFEGLLTEPLLGIRTHLQRSLVPLNLLRYIQSLGPRCISAIVAVSPHRPPEDWESVSSNVLECLPHRHGATLTLMKNLAAPDKAVGASVIVTERPELHQALP